VWQKVTCLQFGSPYVTSGFSLLSIVNAQPFNVMTALFSPDVCNAATVILIITCSAGFLVALLERNNMHLGTPSRGLYWSFLTFLMVAEEQPRQKPARIVMIAYLLANIVGLSVITSIISAKLTTTALSVTYILSLKDVTGTLCVESNYQVLMDFVNRDAGKPVSVVAFPINECIEMLIAGEVEAVVTDRTVLSWYARYYQIEDTFVGPMLQSNPFAFVFANASSGLMGYVNPAIIAATQTDADWIPMHSALYVKYFGTDAAGEPPIYETKVDITTLIVSLAMTGFAILYALVNGDWGPGISRPVWLRKMIEQPSPSADMTDEQAALLGDDLAFSRFVINTLHAMKKRMGMPELSPAHEPKSGKPDEAAADDADAAVVDVDAPLALDAPPAAGRESVYQVHGASEQAVAALVALLLAEMRSMRREMAELRNQVAAQEAARAAQRESRDAMRRARERTAAGGAPTGSEYGSPERAPAPQLPRWGLDRRL
jgi:hypothetical protein